MGKEKENRKKRHFAGMLGAFLLCVFTFVGVYFWSLDVPAKEDKPVTLLTFDYSGSKKKGGSSAAKSSTKKKAVKENRRDPVKTQKTDSPVKKTSTKKSTKKSSNTKSVNDKAVAGKGMFGNNNGSGSGNDDGNGDGLGDGINGPGVSGRTGTLNRKAVSKPSLNNPVKETGKVAVEITVDRSGKVINAKALRTHPYTTSNNPAHYAAAESAAKKYRFSASSNAKEYEIGVVKINFTLN